MKKLNYKLIVSDFDGTLIDDKQCVPEKVRNAINEYVAAGGIFAVCTGRMLCSILPRVRALGLKGLVVAHQGAVIADIESGKLICNERLSYTDAAEICRVINELGFSINAFSDDFIYSDIPKDDAGLKIYESIIGVETTFVGNVTEYVAAHKISAQKVAALVEPELRDGLYTELCKKLGDKYDVTCSAKVLVEVSKSGVTKGEALKFLSGHFGVLMEKTVAIGDNLNDLSMVRVAGVGVAVANAEEKLKAEADFIAVSNNDGAVAQIIEKYGFE